MENDALEAELAHYKELCEILKDELERLKDYYTEEIDRLTEKAYEQGARDHLREG